jgi:glycosyltransferase involved in cell wall biosynthesis
MEPLVSILIPAYNAEEWIADTIESALAQTWPRKEIIVVDDGSSDLTLPTAKQFAAKSVQVVTQANQGASVARNTAYSLCQGDYIQWLDADDLLDPDKVEKQARVLADCPSKRTLLSGAWAHFIYRKSKAQFLPTALWRDQTPVEWMIGKMGDRLHMQPDNWLVSRELSEAAGPWDARLWKDNDGEYFARVMAASDWVKFVPEARSYYRSAGFVRVSYVGGSNKKMESLLLSMKLHISYLRSMEDSERTRAACVRYIRARAPEFYPQRPDIVEELGRLSVELGGALGEPRLPWKYQWIVKCFGWGVGRRAQLMVPRVKTTILITWDKAMFRLEGGGSARRRAA